MVAAHGAPQGGQHGAKDGKLHGAVPHAQQAAHAAPPAHGGGVAAAVRRSLRQSLGRLLDLTPLEAKQAKLGESNIAGIGSKADRELRRQAAGTDPEFHGAGSKPGIEMWRVENRRTAGDTPDFGVKRYAAAEHGTFYSGDAYILLHTYAHDPNAHGLHIGKRHSHGPALAWDLHFWIGEAAPQDVRGVAAYKTVELDDLLEDGPVQRRETQFHESRLFLSYFGRSHITYKEGGFGTGFRHVGPEKYEPRLFMVRSFHDSHHKSTRAFQVPLKARNMNHGNVFVLDAGLKVYMYQGEQSSLLERNKAGLLQGSIVEGRTGKSHKALPDGDFWALLGGSDKDVRAANAKDLFLPDAAKHISAADLRKEMEIDGSMLFQLHDQNGKYTFTKVAEGGGIKKSMLHSHEVFLLVTSAVLWIYVGKSTTRAEKANCMHIADYFLETHKNLPRTLPVVAIKEERAYFNHLFSGMFA
jgi:gelsolin